MNDYSRHDDGHSGDVMLLSTAISNNTSLS